MSSNVQQLMSSSAVLCQARSAALSVSSNAIRFPVRNAQLSMKLSVVVVVEEVGDLVPPWVVGLVLQVVVVLDHQEAVDLDLEEVMVDMVEVDLLQEEVTEGKSGKDGPLTLLEEAQMDMEVDLDIVVEVIVVGEDLEVVVEGMVEVVEDLEEAVVDLAEVHLEEEVVDVPQFHVSNVELFKSSNVTQFHASNVEL